MCLCAGNLELKYLFGLVRTVVNFEMLDADLFHFYCTAWEVRSGTIHMHFTRRSIPVKFGKFVMREKQVNVYLEELHYIFNFLPRLWSKRRVVSITLFVLPTSIIYFCANACYI